MLSFDCRQTFKNSCNDNVNDRGVSPEALVKKKVLPSSGFIINAATGLSSMGFV